jgi:predicted 2-oxoglutarate/Fe(II)-dependent dioxygenase YbiX
MNHQFLTDFVFWDSVPNHHQNKDILLPLIMQNLEKTQGKQKGKWRCEVNTEFFDSLENHQKYIDLIVSCIYPALDNMLKEIPMITPKTSKVVSIWYNYYEKGSTQEVHTHTSKECTFSGVYILKTNEINKTVFYSYGSSLIKYSNASKQLKEAKEGDIILFPSHLLHYVLPCESERITIAFNIDCEFT